MIASAPPETTMLLWDMWESLRQNDDVVAKLDKIYEKWPCYILSIRIALPQWVESQQKHLEAIDPNQPEYQQVARHIYNELKTELAGVLEGAHVSDQLQYKTLLREVQNENDPMKLAAGLKHGLQQEQELLKKISEDCFLNWEKGIKPEDTKPDQISQNAVQIHSNLLPLKTDLMGLRYLYSELQEKMSTMSEIGNAQGLVLPINGSHQSAMTGKGSNHLQDLASKGKEFARQSKELLTKLDEHSEQIYCVIQRWQLDEQRAIAGLADAKTSSLNDIDDTCDTLSGLLLELSQLLIMVRGSLASITNNMECLGTTDVLSAQKAIEDIISEVKVIRDKFIKRCFVISIQPVDVKRNMQPCIVKFRENINQRSYALSAEIRALGGKALGLGASHSELVHVKATLAKDTDLLRRPVPLDVKEFGSLSGAEIPLLQDKDKRVTASFGNITVQLGQNRQRPGSKRKNNCTRELVPDQRCGLVFNGKVQVLNEQFDIQLVSHPLVIVTHGSQERNALGRIIWDRAFSDLESTPYKSPDKAKGSLVADVLSALFKLHTGKGLVHDHLTYLISRLVDTHDQNVDIMEANISRDKFWKEKIRHPDRDYSFWVWFYACMNLIKKYLKTEWKMGQIYGFCGKAMALDMLKNRPDGTFLLRFSESEIEGNQSSEPCGYLTVALIEMDPLTNKRKLYHINKDEDKPGNKSEPYLSAANFKSKRTLRQILLEIEGRDTRKQCKHVLRFVYPDTPFMKAFHEKPEGSDASVKHEHRRSGQKHDYVKTKTHRSLELAMEGCVIEEPRSAYSSVRSVASPESIANDLMLTASGDELTLTGQSFHSPPANIDDVMAVIQEEKPECLNEKPTEVDRMFLEAVVTKALCSGLVSQTPAMSMGFPSTSCYPAQYNSMQQNTDTGLQHVQSMEQEFQMSEAVSMYPSADHNYGDFSSMLATGAGEPTFAQLQPVAPAGLHNGVPEHSAEVPMQQLPNQMLPLSVAIHNNGSDSSSNSPNSL